MRRTLLLRVGRQSDAAVALALPRAQTAELPRDGRPVAAFDCVYPRLEPCAQNALVERRNGDHDVMQADVQSTGVLTLRLTNRKLELSTHPLIGPTERASSRLDADVRRGGWKTKGCREPFVAAGPWYRGMRVRARGQHAQRRREPAGRWKLLRSARIVVSSRRRVQLK